MSTISTKRIKNKSKITNLIRKLFICGGKKKKNHGLYPYRSYKEIKLKSIQHSKEPTEKVVNEVDPEKKHQSKPVSATVLSSSTVDLLVPALNNFKEDVRGSR